MKIFIQILGYTQKLISRLFWLIVCSSLGVVFSAFNIVLIIPMLNVLFNRTEVVMTTLPEFHFSSTYLVDIFNYYFQLIIYQYGRLDALLFVCVLIVVCVFLANSFRFMEHVIATKIKVDLVRNIRMDLFEKVSQLHIGFFKDHKKGDLISRFINDVNELEFMVVKSLKTLLREPITLIVYFSILFTLSVKLTLFTLVVFPITGIIVAEILKRLKKQARHNQESLARILGILDETFGGMRVIKAFNAGFFVADKMREESDYYRKISKSLSYKNELASPVSEVLGTMIVVTIIFFGGQIVLSPDAELEPDMFLGFLLLFAMLIQPIKNLSQSITDLQKVKISAKRIFQLKEVPPAIQNKVGAKKIKQFKKSIEFENVSFAYETERVLNHVNLRIEKGKTIALVGPSGGGKSTLADLIPRFYDPIEGYVKLDGIPLTEYEVESVRQQIGVVSQESILFHDTVFNNIAFGMSNVSTEQVIQAAQVANAHEFIVEMEEGYDTVIGEHGSKLSGGQKQRLNIARAVLKNPPILILDEATSALDAESEQLVQEAIFSLMRNRTSIIIAHRLSTIQNADEIVVIEKGKIEERGTHEQLTHMDGVYKRLITLQKTDH